MKEERLAFFIYKPLKIRVVLVFLLEREMCELTNLTGRGGVHYAPPPMKINDPIHIYMCDTCYNPIFS